MRVEDWIKKVIKMNYPEVIMSPSIIEFYNKTGENGTEYCLKGEQQEEKKTATFEANNAVLLEAFGESACSFYDDMTYCGRGLDVYARANGWVGVNIGYANGYVSGDDGTFLCREL